MLKKIITKIQNKIEEIKAKKIDKIMRGCEENQVHISQMDSNKLLSELLIPKFKDAKTFFNDKDYDRIVLEISSVKKLEFKAYKNVYKGYDKLVSVYIVYLNKKNTPQSVYEFIELENLDEENLE
ncbi:MAG: hypothetical protein IJW82_07020 [Clostridia bacterium]|nr:hypothetical protein [Clostridia bacterium]